MVRYYARGCNRNKGSATYARGSHAIGGRQRDGVVVDCTADFMTEISRMDPFWAIRVIRTLDEQSNESLLSKVLRVFRLIIPRIGEREQEFSHLLDQLESGAKKGANVDWVNESKRVWDLENRSYVQTALSRLFAACGFLAAGESTPYQIELGRSLFVLCSCPAFQEAWFGEVLERLTVPLPSDMGAEDMIG